jgi:glycosyltransferase involved in cell wall biosynthesis
MTPPLRVMEIIAGFAVEGPSGGIAQFGINLVQAMDGEKFERILCGLWDYQTEPEKRRICELNQKGIITFAAAAWEEEKPYHSFLRSLQKMDTWLKKHPVDVIHSHSEFGDAAALYLGLKHRVPILARTVHNNTLWRRRPFRRIFLVNLLYPLAFQLEAGVSQDIVDQLNRRPLARILGKKGQVLYNSIDFSRFNNVVPCNRSEKLASLNIPVDAILAGSVGRITEQKGYTYLLEAAARVIQQEPRFHFIIIGTGPQEQALKEKAARLHLDKYITWTGARSDVPELLSCMDMFISSSLWEGLPTVLMESMSMGTPIVATDIPGTKEVIEPMKTGLLVTPGDPEELARSILSLWSMPELAQELSRQAQKAVVKFDIKSVAGQYERLYEELVSSQ